MQNSKCKITVQNLKIISNTRIKDKYFKIIIHSPIIAKDAKPGQFLNIRVNNSCEPLLRRPFSIHRTKGPNIEILYEIVGKGTEILSQKKAGEYLDIIGPLGNGFDYGTTGTTVLVAGGMGVAPLIFLTEKLVTTSPPHHLTREPLVLIGAKTKRQILCEKEFKSLGCDVKIATDDGSRGFKGKVTDLLKYLLSTIPAKNLGGSAKYCGGDYRLSTIYACGPKPMLKEISRISQKYNIPTQISLEEHMACGIGACLGCVVNTKNGYQRVCKEGPVFAADEIVWE